MKVFLIGFCICWLANLSSGFPPTVKDVDNVTTVDKVKDEDNITTVEPEISSFSTVSVTTEAAPDCKKIGLGGCEDCVNVDGCYYLQNADGLEFCQGINDPRPGEVEWRESHSVEDCQHGGEDPNTTTPTIETTTTTSAPNTTTTTTTEPTTTSTTPDTTTSTTTVTTTTSNLNTTTTATTTTTTEAPDTTTPSPTPTTTTPITPSTSAPAPDPSRARFDGWSFFGGILLTLGLAAIALVGFKYYRLRSGTGGNYNRF